MQSKNIVQKLGIFIFSLGIAFVVYKVMAAWAGIHYLFILLLQFPTYTFAIILSLSITGYLFRFAAWQINLKYLGYQLPVFLSLQYYLAGYLFLPTPARAGLSVRAVYLREHNIPYPVSVTALLLERINDLIATVILSCLIIGQLDLRIILFITVFVGIVCLIRFKTKGISFNLEKIENRFRGNSTNSNIKNSPSNKQESQIKKIIKLLRSQTFIKSQLLVCLGFLLYGLNLYFALNILNANISPHEVIGTYAFSTIVGSFSFIPTGLGGAEAAMLFFLSVFKVQKNHSVAAIILSRLGTIWFVVALGAIATVLIIVRRKFIKS